MRRREFIVALGAALVFTFEVHAQQRPMPVIGYLSAGGPTTFGHLAAAFREGLKESGYIEGQNLHIEYRWAEGSQERVKAFAEELVRRPVDLIYAAGSGEAVAAKALTSTIPIVFTGSSDPVALGLVTSLSRPGGNVTGATRISHSLGAKRLEVLRELLPNASRVAVLVDPRNPSTEAEVKELQAFARARGLEVLVFNASSAEALSPAIEAAGQQGASALSVAGNPLFGRHRERIAALALQHRLPTIYGPREDAEAGGLISYGASLPGSYRQAGSYAGQILKGAKPAEPPVHQPTEFDLVINLKTARALRLDIPASLLAQADEVIE